MTINNFKIYLMNNSKRWKSCLMKINLFYKKIFN